MMTPARLTADIDVLLSKYPAPWRIENRYAALFVIAADEELIESLIAPKAKEPLIAGIVSAVNFAHWMRQPAAVVCESAGEVTHG